MLSYFEKSDFHKSLSQNLTPNDTQDSMSFKVPDDYKFHCFGEEVFSETIIDRGIDTRCTFFDTQWEPLPVNITYDFAKRDILKPRYLDTMYAIAKLFYQDMGYLRCDFYVLRTQDFYIGELTFTPGGGCLPIRPREYDKFLGNFWTPKA
ncbi:ATP-grasp fold amidoligase family protein [uncultured Helicobacter sp.]|uniref:ATP-grasp fold amidoligase family protein n=1 Tax=uncultured Helicobacter sp. TaxID=175537 RepID=UPI00374E5541